MDYKKIDYEKIYEDIIKIDPSIRLVTICDSNGRVMYSQHREGVRNLLTTEESKESLELAVNSWKIRTKLAQKIGKGRYVLAEYEKIKRITMPLGDDDNHLLYITTELQADHSNIIRRIGEITIRKLLLWIKDSTLILPTNQFIFRMVNNNEFLIHYSLLVW